MYEKIFILGFTNPKRAPGEAAVTRALAALKELMYELEASVAPLRSNPLMAVWNPPFSKRPFMTDVAKRAGMSPQSLNQWFKSVDAMLMTYGAVGLIDFTEQHRQLISFGLVNAAGPAAFSKLVIDTWGEVEKTDPLVALLIYWHSVLFEATDYVWERMLNRFYGRDNPTQEDIYSAQLVFHDMFYYWSQKNERTMFIKPFEDLPELPAKKGSNSDALYDSIQNRITTVVKGNRESN